MKHNKRMDVDFSNHELIIVEKEDYLKHTLKHPEYSHMYLVEFLNIDDKLIVSGDYGKWMFCREFHPSKDGYVSDHYWVEKLNMDSTQNGYEFDSEATEELIKERLAELEEELENGDIDEDTYDEYKEYYEDYCLYYIDENKHTYLTNAHNHIPSKMDHEDVPYVTDILPRLKIIFDAFEEICRRLDK